MKTFLAIIYQVLKLLVRAIIWVYYFKVELENGEMNNIKGPCIVVSNHPGTIMDPLNAVVNLNRQVNFLANASLFKNKFSNWFLSTFYCIKIERYADTGGKPLDNEAAFRQATDFLTNGGCLYIAPEGGSYEGRRVNKLKTGLARIAFNTEQENDFKLGLQILPIGLNYADPYEFRRPILVNMGRPFMVSDFKEDWEQNDREAVRKLTAHLKAKMEEVILPTTDPEEDALLAKLEELVQNNEPLSLTGQYVRSKKILGNLQKLRSERPATFSGLSDLATFYFEELKKLDLKDASVAGNHRISILLLILAFPFAWIGIATHFLPAFLTKKLSDLLSSEPVWVPTFKVCGGLVIYPLVIFLQVKLLGLWFSSFGEMGVYLKWGYMAAIIPLGLVAEWSLEKWKLYKSRQRFIHLGLKKQEDLMQQRKDILGTIHWAKP